MLYSQNTQFIVEIHYYFRITNMSTSNPPALMFSNFFENEKILFNYSFTFITIILADYSSERIHISKNMVVLFNVIEQVVII